MKNLILPIVIILLTGAGMWYFTKDNNKPIQTLETNQVSKESSATTTATTGSSTNEKIINKSNVKNMNATLHTNLGDITIRFNEATPRTVENFVKLVKSGFYDGTKFHRVIKDFMNQGGDPLSKDDSQIARWGTGGPGYQFNDEITSTNNNKVGSISMANAGPNTNGSQFFINVADNSFLDTKHTVFGNVIEGMDVVTKINNVKTGTNDRPIEAVVIKSISIE